jgi:hypothetical protein
MEGMLTDECMNLRPYSSSLWLTIVWEFVLSKMHQEYLYPELPTAKSENGLAAGDAKFRG